MRMPKHKCENECSDSLHLLLGRFTAQSQKFEDCTRTETLKNSKWNLREAWLRRANLKKAYMVEAAWRGPEPGGPIESPFGGRKF